MIARVVRPLVVRGAAALPEPVADGDKPSILVLRPDHLGDIIFTGPALRRLRAALPGWTITLAVGPWSAVAAGHVHGASVDEVLVVPFPGFSRAPKPNPLQPYQLARQFAAELHRRDYGAALVLRDDHWWGALAAKLAGIPLRIGAATPLTAPLLTHPVPTGGHSVQRNIQLVAAALEQTQGVRETEPACSVSDPLRWDLTGADRLAADALVGSEPYVVIHPGSGAEVKLWPSERWARVADSLASRGLRIVLTGNDNESGLTRRLQASLCWPSLDLTGRTDLPTLAAVLAGAELVLGVDSGPLHLAVAVGTPTLQLYGPSDPAKFGPWGSPERHQVIQANMTCPRCGDLSPARPAGCGCMVAVRVPDVVEAAWKLLDRG